MGVANNSILAASLFVVVAVVASVAPYLNWDRAVPLAGMVINYVRSWTASSGTTVTELAVGYNDGGQNTSPRPNSATPKGTSVGAWPSYNKTLTSERYSQLAAINTSNASRLKVLCTYDKKLWGRKIGGAIGGGVITYTANGAQRVAAPSSEEEATKELSGNTACQDPIKKKCRR